MGTRLETGMVIHRIQGACIVDNKIRVPKGEI